MPLPTATKYGREASQPPTVSSLGSHNRAVSGTAVTFHYYTQDYLGNNRAVINGSTGAIEQTVAYYPYGAVIANPSTPTTGQPYKFGGKELITTNGLNEYDFGARQYYSAVPAFTRIDPMAEKYQHLSPYLFCGNDPVNAMDPTGRDTWTLNSTGNLISREEHDRFDRIIVNNTNNEAMGTWQGDYGSISAHTSITEDTGMTYSVFEAINDETGTEVFEFLSKKTSVEWSQFKTGSTTESINYLTSSHEADTDSSAVRFIDGRGSYIPIREWTHSHPNNTPYPSGLNVGDKSGDVPFARKIDRINSIKAIYRIYIPRDGSYVDYSSSASDFDDVYDGYFNILNDINVTAPRIIRHK